MEIYKQIGLKAEYIYAYRMLVYLLLQAADFNALARELRKFTEDAKQVGSGHEGYRVVLRKLCSGQDPKDLEKEKGVIIRCGGGTIGCGLDKVKVF